MHRPRKKFLVIISLHYHYYSFHFYYNIQKLESNERNKESKKLQKTEKKETLKVHDVIWKKEKVLKINNGSKENRYAAAISWSGDTERREKNGDLFVIKKLKI